jgi:hypothetical protein
MPSLTPTFPLPLPECTSLAIDLLDTLGLFSGITSFTFWTAGRFYSYVEVFFFEQIRKEMQELLELFCLLI